MQIHILSHNKFGKIHIAIINGNIYLLGKDAADSLGFSDTRKAISRHVQAKDKFTFSDLVKMAQSESQVCPDNLAGQTHGEPQFDLPKTSRQDTVKIPHNAIFINESGLYSLVLYSNLPAAKELQHWVTSEVLPSIRKNGYYINPHAITPPPAPVPKVPENELSRRDRIKILRELLDYTDDKDLRNDIICEIAFLVTNKNY